MTGQLQTKQANGTRSRFEGVRIATERSQIVR